MEHLHHGHGVRRIPGHEAALWSVQKPPSKPWRTRGGLTPALRVYRVEPREFRNLVQSLTGAPTTARRVTVVPMQPVPVRAGGDDSVAGQMYPPWCSFPLVAPAAAMHPGLDGHQLI